MPFELSITIKNEEKRQTTKHLVYDSCAVSEEDPIIKTYIDNALAEFKDEPEDIRIRVTLEVK